jgi:uncharacterized protein
MIALGQFNELVVVKQVDFGYYLDGGPYGEILLPNNEVMATATVTVGELLEVFIYNDNENRLIATTRQPLAEANSFAFLQCKEVNQVGAFMDWGLMKQLFVPFREQQQRMQAGSHYVVYVYNDIETERLVASARISRFVKKTLSEGLKIGDAVQVLVSKKTELGYNAIVNNEFWGLIYQSDVFKPLRVGQRCEAFIKNIREDGKLDLTLQKMGFDGVKDAADVLLEILKGSPQQQLFLTDDSDSADIRAQLNMSKKVFKKAVGTLYKQGIILLKKDRIVVKHSK